MYGNYNYNPFLQQQTPYQPPQYQQPQYQAPQPVQPQLARVVSDFNEITIGDIPTNGTTAYFIKGDGSEIQARKWSEDGRIIASTYKPSVEAQKPETDPFEQIFKRFDALEEKLSTRATRKKEVAEE